jgi:hypothetical protein
LQPKKAFVIAAIPFFFSVAKVQNKKIAKKKKKNHCSG